MGKRWRDLRGEQVTPSDLIKRTATDAAPAIARAAFFPSASGGTASASASQTFAFVQSATATARASASASQTFAFAQSATAQASSTLSASASQTFTLAQSASAAARASASAAQTFALVQGATAATQASASAAQTFVFAQDATAQIIGVLSATATQQLPAIGQEALASVIPEAGPAPRGVPLWKFTGALNLSDFLDTAPGQIAPDMAQWFFGDQPLPQPPLGQFVNNATAYNFTPRKARNELGDPLKGDVKVLGAYGVRSAGYALMLACADTAGGNHGRGFTLVDTGGPYQQFAFTSTVSDQDTTSNTGKWISFRVGPFISNATDDYTAEAWIKIDGPTPGTRTNLLSLGANGTLSVFNVEAVIPASGPFSLTLVSRKSNDLPESVTSAAVVTRGEFHHLVVQRKAGYSTLYVDGVALGTVYTPVHSSRSGGTWALESGATNYSLFTDNFYSWIGTICDLRFTYGVARYSDGFARPLYPHSYFDQTSAPEAFAQIATADGGAGLPRELLGDQLIEPIAQEAGVYHALSAAADQQLDPFGQAATALNFSVRTASGAQQLPAFQQTAVAYVAAGRSVSTPVVGDPLYASVVLLAHCEAGALDSGPLNIQPSAAGAWTYDTTRARFGASSSGTSNSNITEYRPEFGALSATDFTLEFWAYHLSAPSGAYAPIGNLPFLAVTRPTRNGTAYWGVRLTYGGLALEIWDEDITASAYGAVRVGEWQHVAVSRSGSTVRLYVDGRKVASRELPEPLFVAWYDTQFEVRDSIACLDELRITSAARYVGDTFALQSLPFPNGYGVAPLDVTQFARAAHGAGTTRALTTQQDSDPNSVALVLHNSTQDSSAAATPITLKVGYSGETATLAPVPGAMNPVAWTFIPSNPYTRVEFDNRATHPERPTFTLEMWARFGARELGNFVDFGGWDDFLTDGVEAALGLGCEDSWGPYTTSHSPYLTPQKDDRLYLYVTYPTSTGSGVKCGTQTPILMGEWYHFAVTWDGTYWRAYVNGNLEVQVTASDTPVKLKGRIGPRPITGPDVSGRAPLQAFEEFRFSWNQVKYTSDFVPAREIQYGAHTTFRPFTQTATAVQVAALPGASADQALRAPIQFARVKALAQATQNKTLPAFDQSATATGSTLRSAQAAQTLPAFGQVATARGRWSYAQQSLVLPAGTQTAAVISSIRAQAAQTLAMGQNAAARHATAGAVQAYTVPACLQAAVALALAKAQAAQTLAMGQGAAAKAVAKASQNLALAAPAQAAAIGETLSADHPRGFVIPYENRTLTIHL